MRDAAAFTTCKSRSYSRTRISAIIISHNLNSDANLASLGVSERRRVFAPQRLVFLRLENVFCFHSFSADDVRG